MSLPSRSISSCSALLAAAALATLAATGDAAAQIRGSERGSVTQTLDGTTVTIAYSRPAARGRDLFGTLVPNDIPWTGANWATTIEVDKDVRLNGASVAAGTYSVWIIPREADWTVVLDPRAELFHFQKPDSTPDQIRFAAQPERGPHVEMLTWDVPSVLGDAAVLRMSWGETRLPLQLIVPPSKPVVLTPEQRQPYVGSYDLAIMDGLGWPTSATLEVFEKDGRLRGRLPFPFHPGDELEFDMVPAGRDRFSPGLYRDGALFNIEMGGAWEFELGPDGRASSVVLRGVEGSPFGQGDRTTSH